MANRMRASNLVPKVQETPPCSGVFPWKTNAPHLYRPQPHWTENVFLAVPPPQDRGRVHTRADSPPPQRTPKLQWPAVPCPARALPRWGCSAAAVAAARRLGRSVPHCPRERRPLTTASDISCEQ